MWAIVLPFLIGILSNVGNVASAASPRALFVDQTGLPGDDSAQKPIADAIRAAGYEIETISMKELAEKPPHTDLLIVPCAKSLPLSTIKSVTAYLKSGGTILACGLPMWDLAVTEFDGKWTTREEYQRAIASTRAQHIAIDFAHEDVAQWKRETNAIEPDVHEISQDQLHVQTPSLKGWDMVGRPLPNAFPAGHTLTCFRAKGGPGTTQLAIEWRETDGSRWIATIPLTEQWQDYVLSPDAFKAWQPPESRKNDHFRPGNAAKVLVGLAFSHTDVPRAKHEYWLGNIGTAPPPTRSGPDSVKLPVLEALSPEYQVYRAQDMVTAFASPGQCIVREIAIPAPAGVALQPRPQASGIDKNRPWRWQPLLEARSSNGDFRGTIAAMTLGQEHMPGVWAAFAPVEARFYKQVQVQHVLSDLAAAIARGLFLREAGAEFYTVFENQPVRLGARIIDRTNDSPKDVRLRIRITTKRVKDPIYERMFAVHVPAESGVNIYDTWSPKDWPVEGYVVTTELLQGDAVVDRIAHELHVWRPAVEPKFITTAKGDFWLDGQPWKAHGVNYMPSSGIGLSDGEMFENWIGSAGYDPVVIQRDLERVKNLGFNAVSAFIYRQSMESQNLLDFLRRCDALGMHVNLSLRPGDPIEYKWDDWKQIIEHYRLKQNDTVFAYDIAWEATHESRGYQMQHYRDDWEKWVVTRYGSIENAEKVWGVPAPRENNAIAVPLAEHLITDDPWRKMIFDYREFLDELLDKKYGDARRRIREIDPNHAVSFRMNIAADPTARMDAMLAYDLWGLRKAVDIFAPEAYGRIGDWEWVKPGLFSAAYARLCDPEKPFIWAEAGFTVWDQIAREPSPGKMEVEAHFYHDLYRMLRESGSDGIFFWWYPGGYRVNEHSDFGIINPDGTDRPVTTVIREEGKKFLSATKPTGAEVVIEISRNEDARGLFGIYEKVREQYWRNVDAGNTVKLKWKEEPRGVDASVQSAE